MRPVGDGDWLEWVRPGGGKPTRTVWAWIRGEWRDGWVEAEARDRHGWWFFVWWPSNPEWVHEAATLPYAPTPEELAKTRAAWGMPELTRAGDLTLGVVLEDEDVPVGEGLDEVVTAG